MQPVLAIYDLRGIQEFIFRTNRVKEIIGASQIVENLLEAALSSFVNGREGENHNLRWFDDKTREPCPFVFDTELDAAPKEDSEILYCGGGNLLVVWRKAELAKAAGRFMSRYILERAYSLSLSWAMTAKTDNYLEDYKALCRKLDFVKNMGYRAVPLSGVPFTIQENGTGLPAVIRDEEERISQETRLKRDRYAEGKDSWAEQKALFCQVIDDMTADTQKNYVAIVHIDGNSMGERIRKRLSECGNTYADAIQVMRRLSLRISNTFRSSLNDTITDQGKRGERLMLRPIICAGDDITFIARADLALPMVERFIGKISGKAMCDKKDGPDIEQYGFSACAGIAYIRTHYPFYRAYELCEQLCASAKKKAREAAGKNSPMGSYVDFHIVGSGAQGSIGDIRKREYINAQGDSLLQRPLSLDQSKENEADSVSALIANMEWFQKKPRRWVKALRNAYQMSRADVQDVFAQMMVHNQNNSDEGKTLALFDEKERQALCYDALELMDMISAEGMGERKEIHEEKADN